MELKETYLYLKIDRFQALRTFELSTGEVINTIDEFLEYCNSEKRKIYVGYLLPLRYLLQSLEVPIKEYTSSIKVGKTTIHDLNGWKTDINNNEDAIQIEKICHFNGNMYKFPSTLIAKKYSYDTYNNEIYDALKGEVKITVQDLGDFKKDCISSYKGGLIACPAELGKKYKKVKSYDLNSAYPFFFYTSLFPSSESIQEDPKTFKIIDGKILRKDGSAFKKGFTAKIKFVGLKRKKWVKLPCIQYKHQEEYLYKDCVYDYDGFLSGDIKISVNPPELLLIDLQYDYENSIIEEIYTHDLDNLDNFTLHFIEKMYNEKKDGILLDKIKLNLLGGAWSRSPLKSYMGIMPDNEEQVDRAINIYNGSDGKKPYCMGTKRTWDYRWTPYAVSYTRLTIGIIEKKLYDRGCKILYSDTDSIKFLGNEGNIFKDYNEKIKSINTMNNDLGTFRNEKDKWKDGGIFYGRKQYLSFSKGEIYTHFSGLNKKVVNNFIKAIGIKYLNKKEIFLPTGIWMIREFDDLPLGSKYTVCREIRFAKIDGTIMI